MSRAALLLLLVGCADPVRSARIDALGPETKGVAQGPLHRAGQPCLACHDGQGDGVRELSLGGTVYLREGGDEPAPGVRVELEDARGSTFTVATNCAGNFYVEPSAYAPVYPLRVALEGAGARIEMESAVQRDGSCASCHAAGRSSSSTGVVYLAAEADPTFMPSEPAVACP